MTMTEQIAKFAEAYGKVEAEGQSGRYLRIAVVAVRAGMTPAEAEAVIRDLHGADEFRAEPWPYAETLLTAADRHYAVVFGGEARHVIRWE